MTIKSEPAQGAERAHVAAVAAAALVSGEAARAQSTPTITQKSVTVDGSVKLNYLEAGSGKTIVLVPGWSQTAEQFKFQLEGLAASYRVIAFDMRGHGDSDKPAGVEGYDMRALAEEYWALAVAYRRPRHRRTACAALGGLRFRYADRADASSQGIIS